MNLKQKLTQYYDGVNHDLELGHERALREFEPLLLDHFGRDSQEYSLYVKGKYKTLMERLWRDDSVPRPIRRMSMDLEPPMLITEADIDKALKRLLGYQPWAEAVVESAAARAKVNARITVEAYMDLKSTDFTDFEEPLGTFNVEVEGIGFTLFHDGGKPIVDDILEDPDDADASIEAFAKYQKVIMEIKKPGSTTSGKILKLYTARPVKDRKRYEDATTIPVGIFLTNSFRHAEGLAHDLSSREPRDVYEVRVRESDVVLTLDGSVKYYQAVGEGSVPAKVVLA